jgi:hypothetical protein
MPLVEVEPQAMVRAREDWWVDVPALTPLGNPEPIQLRPGSEEGKVFLKPRGGVAVEVSLTDLRRGLKLIEEEHAR